MLKSELVKAMKDMPDDAVAVCVDPSGGWSNIDNVRMNGSVIEISFEYDERPEAGDAIRCEHDGFCWVWDEDEKTWLIDINMSGGPPSPHEPSPEPPQFNPEED